MWRRSSAAETNFSHGGSEAVTVLRQPVATTLPAMPAAEPTLGERLADEETKLRVELMTTEAGWLMIAVGVVGVIVPGIVGMPFLLVGAFVLFPGGPELLSRWSVGDSPRFVRALLRQAGRFLDDLERRYPRT